MIFIETSVFTKDVLRLLTDDQYSELQQFLAVNPNCGEVIKGTGGIRKARWAQPSRGKGKRGGVRVIYFRRVNESQILMLVMYDKDEQDDLTADERRQLRAIVENWS